MLFKGTISFGASLVAQMVKNPPAVLEIWFNPWVRRMPWRREWLPAPIFLPRESHGQRSLLLLLLTHFSHV